MLYMKKKLSGLFTVGLLAIIASIIYLGFYEKNIEPTQQTLTIEVTTSK